MNMSRSPSLRGRPGLHAVALLPLIAALAVPPASALTRSQSAQGWAFLEGGVGRAEIESMDAEKGKYSLWIITAARVSGAYLADVELSIADAKGVKVFERRLQGPWLFIDLPLGSYEVRARVGKETVARGTMIHPGDHHQMVLYFDVEGDVPQKP